MIVILLLMVVVMMGCGEVALQRKYKLTIMVCDSPGANVALLLDLPEIAKKYDTNPNINPTLSVPAVGRGLAKVEAGVDVVQLPIGGGSFIYMYSPQPAKEARDASNSSD